MAQIWVLSFDRDPRCGVSLSPQTAHQARIAPSIPLSRGEIGRLRSGRRLASAEGDLTEALKSAANLEDVHAAAAASKGLRDFNRPLSGHEVAC